MANALTDNRITKYFKEVRAELRKVTWPSRAETMRLSAIVIMVLVVMSIFMAVIDYIFAWLIRLIIGLGTKI